MLSCYSLLYLVRASCASRSSQLAVDRAHSLSYSMAQPAAEPRKSLAGVVTVSIAQGALRGRKGKTLSGGPLVSFLGVPYAKPPVGPLRFKPPQAPESWTGIRDALQEGANCPHIDIMSNQFVGDEDCLFLNVYTPKLPAVRTDTLKPVMVWIHGGGFTVGSGNSDVYGPDYLVDAGVVLVTFNYRLGPLGFLSLGSKEASGNMGLRDQALALRWVQQNIASFGGDPKNVTIFGESAGSASVHFQMLSPMSKGLFHRAIAQSGTALNVWAVTRYARDRAFRLGEAMGCKTDDPQQLMEFLRDATPRQMVEALEKAKTKEERRRGVLFTFIPCVEAMVPGQEAFLAEHPESLVKDGKFHRVPFMVGVNSHESIFLLKDIIANPTSLRLIDTDFDKVIPDNLQPVKRDLQRSRKLSDKIKDFYFGSKSLSEDTLMEYIDLNTDSTFGFGIHKTVKLQSTLAPNVPIYYYQFCFDGALNFFKKMNQGNTKLPGACHADDIGYLFRQRSLDISFPPDSPEMRTIRRMVKMWTNFAKTGNPTPELDEDVTVRWTPYTASNPCHLRIDTELSLGGEVEKKRMDFWEELYQAKL